MIPQGTYLIENDPDTMSALHSSWAGDIASIGPWAMIDGMWRATTQGEATILAVPSCKTTMTTARLLFENGKLGTWGCVISGTQTGGRGQMRRPWVSAPGNLHASIILPKPPGSGMWGEALAQLLPLVAGYVVCTVLETFANGLRLKWPNDILQNNRKVGGMLIEERNGRSILGLGVNLAGFPLDEEMREDHSVSACKLVMPSFSGGALTLLQHLVSQGKNVYACMLDEIPPARLIAKVESRLAWMGQTIRVLEACEPPFEAVVTGLSPSGGLVVIREGEEVVLHSGSISPLSPPFPIRG